jgi:fucose permease
MPTMQKLITTFRRADMLSVYMHGTYFLTGVGIMLLGPLLPIVSRQWSISDSSSGMLLAAQFLGSFVGAVLIQSNLRSGLKVGGLCLVTGYTSLAIATHLPSGYRPGLAALLVGGFGQGRLINTISVLAGTRYTHQRGRALMSLNLVWSAGALLAPLIVGFCDVHFSIPGMVGIYALIGLSLLVFQLSLETKHWPQTTETAESAPPLQHPHTAWMLTAYFALLLFLFGALENSLSGWISSFAVRYTHTALAYGVFSTTMLWVGITAGRALGLLLLRVIPERQVQMLSLGVAIIASSLLVFVHRPEQLLPLAVVIGCGLAPFIPVTASLFFAEAKPTTRQAGLVLAISALGGAVLQWGVGVLSQHTGSLKLALELPPIVGVLLLILCALSPLVAAKAQRPSLVRD